MDTTATDSRIPGESNDLLGMLRQWYSEDHSAQSRRDWLNTSYRVGQEFRSGEWNVPEHLKEKSAGYIFKPDEYHKIGSYIVGKMFADPLRINFLGRTEEDHQIAGFAEQAHAWGRDLVDAAITEQAVAEDMFYLGLGVVRTRWDAETWDDDLWAGMPRYEQVDPGEILLDSRAKTLAEMRRMHRYHRITPEVLKERFPGLDGLAIHGDSFHDNLDDGGNWTEDDARSRLCTVIETQYFRDDWREVVILPPEWLQALAEVGIVDINSPFVPYDDALIEVAQRLAALNPLLDLGALESGVQRKRIERLMSVWWKPGVTRILSMREIKRKPGRRARRDPGFTYTFFPFKERMDTPYAAGAPYYTRELFWMRAIVLTLMIEDLKKRTKYGGMYHPEAFPAEKAETLARGDSFVPVDTDGVQDIIERHGIHGVFHELNRQGIDPGVMQIFNILGDELHDFYAITRQAMGEVAHSRASGYLQDVLSAAAQIPLIPLMNRMRHALRTSNEKLFDLLAYLPSGTQIRIIHGDNAMFYGLREPMTQAQAEAVIARNPRLYKGAPEKIIASRMDGEGLVNLNDIDATFDVNIELGSASLMEKQRKSESLITMRSAGLVDRQTVIESSPDIEDPKEVLRRLEEEEQIQATIETLARERDQLLAIVNDPEVQKVLSRAILAGENDGNGTRPKEAAEVKNKL